jgi:hypothetical protein
LFYRPDAGSNWVWERNALKTKVNQKSGYITVDTLRRGEYTFGNLADSSMVSLLKSRKVISAVKVFPNPARHKFSVEFSDPPLSEMNLKIVSVEGKEVFQKVLSGQATVLDISQLSKGTYTVSVTQEKTNFQFSQKLIVE